MKRPFPPFFCAFIFLSIPLFLSRTLHVCEGGGLITLLVLKMDTNGEATTNVTEDFDLPLSFLLQGFL